jgi:hypothetical protein
LHNSTANAPAVNDLSLLATSARRSAEKSNRSGSIPRAAMMANQYSRFWGKPASVNLYLRRVRLQARLPILLEQRTFRSKPILDILSRSAAAFDADLVSAQLDLSTCGMALGSLQCAFRWGVFSYLGHDFLL